MCVWLYFCRHVHFTIFSKSRKHPEVTNHFVRCFHAILYILYMIPDQYYKYIDIDIVFQHTRYFLGAFERCTVHNNKLHFYRVF